MRLFAPVTLALLLAFSRAAIARDRSYMGATRNEVLRRLGIPAQICIGNGPEHVMWYYYYLGTDKTFRVLAFGFRDGRVVSYSLDPEFDSRRLLSTDRSSDLSRIYQELGREKARE